MTTDPFDALRRPVPSHRPRIEFAVALRRRIEEELPMTDTTNTSEGTPLRVAYPRMIHVGVPDADRAMAFFGALLDWEAERVAWEGHVRHYLINTDGPQVVLTDEPAAPAFRLGFPVSDVAVTMEAIASLGGAVGDRDLSDATHGWAMADDGQGVALVVWTPGRDYPHAPATKPARSLIEWIEVRVPDVERARALYRGALGWEPNGLDPAPAADVKVYFTIDELDAMRARVRDLGGTAGDPYVIGPGRAADCTDDQGTRFTLWQAVTDR